MEYDLIPSSLTVNFAPGSVTEEILQNVLTIITTPKYSVPLSRELGVDAAWLDDPTPVAQAKLTSEIVSAINKWEPRAKVARVSYVTTEDGILVPKVKVSISE